MSTGTAGSAAARAWGGNTWWGGTSSSDSLDNAITRGSYVTFALTALEGYSLAVSDVAAYNVRRSSSGPSLGQWQYQLGSGLFTNIGSAITWGSTTTATGNLQTSISLSGITDLQSVAAGTPVTFRIVNYNTGTAGSSGGTWYLNDPSNTATSDFVINGAVSGTGGGNNLFWDGASGWASSIAASGGSGTWADGSGNWDSAKTANFGGTAGIVTLQTPTAGAGLGFTTTGYTLAGGTLTLAAASIDTNTISVATAATATVNAPVAGFTGLTKTGAGTLVLAAPNTFSGGVRISSGTLSVASNEALGDTANPIEFNGGTLAAGGSIDLGTRQISGASGVAGIATIAVPSGATLSTSGGVNLAALTLASSGTLSLSGGSTALGSIAAAAASGTAAIFGPISFGNTNRTIDVASGGTLLLDGGLSNNATLSKQGGGTLVLTQDNGTNLSRFQLGLAGSTNGGTIRVSSGGALGANQMYFNYGTIEAAEAITLGGGGFGGLSIGGRTATPARFAGEAIEVTGSIGLFGSGAAGPMRVNVDNASTFSALMVGSTTSNITGLTFGGTGSLRLTGDGARLTLPVTLTESLRASVVNDGLVSGGGVLASSLLTVQSAASLSGNGIIGGLLVSNGGTLEPGLSPGVLTTTANAGFGQGGNYNWQLVDATGTAGGGWDVLSVGGGLDIASTSADPFRINLWTLSGTSPDISGTATNFDPAQDFSWTIATATGGITGFAADKFVVRTSSTNGTGGFANGLAGGTFRIAQAGNDLQLVFSVAGAVTTIDVASGTQTQSQAGYPTLTGATPVVKTGGGTLVLDQSNLLTGSTTVQQGTLQLANGSALGSSTLAVAAGATASVANYLTTSVGGLDLSANGLVDLTNGSLSVTSGLTAPQLVAELLEGRGDGSWTGTSGITSSTAAADVASSIPRSVGWLDNGDGSLTVAYAAPGDTNLDWSIDILDAANFLALGKFDTGAAATWPEGDFSYDGVVDILDAADFFSTGLFDAGNYNTAPGSAGAVAAVPEPALPVALACAGLVSARCWIRIRRTSAIARG